MHVLIKPYGYLEVIKTDGNYSLVETKQGGKICFNTLGCEFKQLDTKEEILTKLNEISKPAIGWRNDAKKRHE